VAEFWNPTRSARRDHLAGESPRSRSRRRSQGARQLPARVCGELSKVLDNDAVVIGDGGDFVSFAGKYIEPECPSGWLDAGPFGCLGTGSATRSRPGSQ
jgi:thiamine pyrophosphate-dependent acetolactate synthase large subunit-like protein